jgi:2,4-dienoyl-CoA reductase-like NADH-dependent reductase (Old Yellow Enzyme family)
MWRERPGEFVKAVFGIMPKEFVFESIVTELDDEELNRMIEAFREQQRLAQEQPLKMIEIRQPENAR